MSTLIVQLPAVPRLAAQHADTPPIGDATEFDYLRLGENGQVAAQGRCAVADLPAAHEVVAVLGPADLAWHRPVLPKAPGSRMRQALGGVLEEALLEDDASLHFALAPGASAGQPTWVAALDKGWLQARIAQLEAAGLTVDRVVPGWAPDGPTAGHVFADDRGLQLAWRDAQGPICLPLASSSARALLGQLSPDEPVQWTACPEGAAEAAMLAGAPVAALSQAERLIEAARSAWNLRQFDLQPQRRGQRAAREVLRQAWNDPAWRPARIGLLALVVVQLLGTNLWAWRQRSALDERRLAMNTLLQTTFPQVRAVIDAPAQMQQQVDLLRALAGQPGETDLEPLLQAAQAAWPASRGPADGATYQNQRLTLNSPGWTPPEIDAFRTKLLALGLDAEASAAGPTLMRAAPGTRPPAPPAASAQVNPAPGGAPIAPPGGMAPNGMPPGQGPALPPGAGPGPRPAPAGTVPPINPQVARPDKEDEQ